MAIKKINKKKVNVKGGTRRRSVDCNSQDISHGPTSRGSIGRNLSSGSLATAVKRRWSSPTTKKDDQERPLVERIFWFYSETATEERQPYRIHPASAFMNVWNVLAAFFIITCALFLPFEMSFGYKYSLSGSADQLFWAVLWPTMDTYFFIDLGVNFRLCFMYEGELEQSTRRIAQNYVSSGWFFIDFLSSMSSPLALLAQGIGIGRNMRILKLLKLAKLMRLARLKKLMEGLGDMAADAKLFFSMLKLFVGVFAFSHIICCGWWSIGVYNDTDENAVTWYKSYYGLTGTIKDGGFPDFTTGDKYWGSMYWSFISITTVGYGDVLPTNDQERKYAMLTTFFGTGMFAFITGEITALATSRQASQQALGAKLDAVKEFMAYHRVPKQLVNLVRDYYKASFHKGYFNSDEVLFDLPADLSSEVEHAVACNKFTSSGWFRIMSLHVSHDVTLSKLDTAALAPMVSNDSKPVDLHTASHKQTYEVMHTDSGIRQRVPAKELLMFTGKGTKRKQRFVWRKELTKKQDVLQKASIKRFFSFSDASRSLYSAIVDVSEVKTFATGAVVCKDGAEARHFLYLDEGNIRVEKIDGLNSTKACIVSGTWMGLCDRASLITGKGGKTYFTKNFVALSRCKIMVVNIDDLRATLLKHGNAVLYGMQFVSLSKPTAQWRNLKNNLRKALLTKMKEGASGQVVQVNSKVEARGGTPTKALVPTPNGQILPLAELHVEIIQKQSDVICELNTKLEVVTKQNAQFQFDMKEQMLVLQTMQQQQNAIFQATQRKQNDQFQATQQNQNKHFEKTILASLDKIKYVVNQQIVPKMGAASPGVRRSPFANTATESIEAADRRTASRILQSKYLVSQ